MHELSLAISILDIAGDEASRHGGSRVLAMEIEVGKESGVDPVALLFALELAGKETLLEKAGIKIVEPPDDSLRIVSLTIDEKNDP